MRALFAQPTANPRISAEHAARAWRAAGGV